MTNDDEAEVRQRAAEIATRGLVRDGDLLLACRDLAALRDRLHWVPEEVLDPIVAVASETDDLPLGDERRFWRHDALATKDAEARDYRAKVEKVVSSALRRIIELS